MNDSDGNTITPEYSVAAAMQSSSLAIKHYPDPQAMPDAQLVLSTVNADAAALRRLRTMAFKVHQMRVKASDTGRRWMNLLEQARDIQYSTLDMQSETPTLKKPRGEIGSPGPPGPKGVRCPYPPVFFFSRMDGMAAADCVFACVWRRALAYRVSLARSSPEDAG